MRSARFPLRFPVRYRRVGDRLWRQGMTENISGSGVLFRVGETLPIEADLELLLELPSMAAVAGHAEIVCRGRVVRTIDPSPDQPWLAAAMAIDDFDFLSVRG